MITLVKPKRLYVHRVSYELNVGPLGDMHVHHKCLNRLCLRPDHLEAVSQAENNRRAVAERTRRRQSAGD